MAEALERAAPPDHDSGGDSPAVAPGDLSSAADPDSGGDGPDPGTRGELFIEPKVFERIASKAAAEVDGVRRQSAGGMSGLVGRELPRSSAQVAGSRVRLETEIAAAWPAPLADVAADVRERVRNRVTELSGHSVDRVDVNVPDTAPGGGRSRRGTPVTAQPADVPKGPAKASIVGFLLALVLLALAVVFVRDALLAAGAFSGRQLVPRAVAGFANLRQRPAVLVAAIIAVVVGLVLLWLSLTRRSRPPLRLPARTPVYLATADVARLSSSAAATVDGVLDADSRVSSSTVQVSIAATGPDPEIADAVSAAVTERLAGIGSRRGTPLDVRTTIRRGQR